MGTNIVLPALEGSPRPATYQPIDPLEEFQRASALKSEANQQQMQQQQIQMQQQQLDDAQKLRQLAPRFVQKDENGKITGYDVDGAANAMLGAGINPNTVAGLRNTYAESVKNLAAANKATLDLEDEKNNKAFEVLESLRGVMPKAPSATPASIAANVGPDRGVPIAANLPNLPNPDPGMTAHIGMQGAMSEQPPVAGVPGPAAVSPEAMQAYHSAIMKLARLGINVGQLNPNQFPTEDQLNGFEAGLGTHKQALADAKEIAQTQEAAGKGAESQAEAGLKQIELNLAKNATPGSFDQQIDHLNMPPAQAQVLKAQINDSLGRGDVAAAKKIVQGAIDNVQAINRDVAVATNPQVQAGKVALARATEQARVDAEAGDPTSMGQMLAKGMISPSEIISKFKPELTQKMLKAANDASMQIYGTPQRKQKRSSNTRRTRQLRTR